MFVPWVLGLGLENFQVESCGVQSKSKSNIDVHCTLYIIENCSTVVFCEIWVKETPNSINLAKCITSNFGVHLKCFRRKNRLPWFETRSVQCIHLFVLNKVAIWSASWYSFSFSCCLCFFEDTIHLNLIWYKLIKSSHVPCELQKINNKRAA